jgi:hypothetical protein
MLLSKRKKDCKTFSPSMVAEYQMILPNEKDLVAEIEKTRALLENRMKK